MTSNERQKRIKQIERVVSTLQSLGWRIEEVHHIDEVDEPLRTRLILSCEPESVIGGLL